MQERIITTELIILTHWEDTGTIKQEDIQKKTGDNKGIIILISFAFLLLSNIHINCEYILSAYHCQTKQFTNRMHYLIWSL